MSSRPTRAQKVITVPIQLLFRWLQNKVRLQIWLFDQSHLRLEGKIVGFDEYMNVVLDDAEEIAGHNIIGFDLPIIRKFFPWFQRIGDCLDTLLLSRLYHPNLIDIDKRHCWKHMPLQLYGRHSLEAYGYRLGEYKGEFGKDTDWKDWSQSMQDYMVQDVVVTNKLCEHFHPYLIGSK